MSFTRNHASLEPIHDTVFAVASQAKEDQRIHGDEAVVNATIGSLYDEAGHLVALDSVFDHYDQISHRDKASYAASFTGNPDYRQAVWDWVTQGSGLNLPHSVIATPGGTGAISSSLLTFLDPGETLILPDIAWGSYQLMADQYGFPVVHYAMFEGDHFNLPSLQAAIEEVQARQGRAVIILNSPCHNPTGYSLSDAEWTDLVQVLNAAGEQGPVVLINDIAYIDYSYDLAHSRDYMKHFEDFSESVLAVIGFSCSKTLTSYGLRCGAAILCAQRPEDVREAEIVLEKNARATWSNIPNAAMENFVWVVQENREAYLAEKQGYINLLDQRSSLFLQEAEAAGLAIYPYREGFFVTLQVDDQARAQAFHAALMEEHIYTVLVHHGIRVACCSLPLTKTQGLAAKMKAVLEALD